MKTKYKLLLGTLATITPATTTSCSEKPKEQKRPNILFILSDDHSKEAISAYGGILAPYAPTPNIDRIAQSGAIMNNVVCTNSISGPSRACLITGKYSTTNGFFQNEGGIVFDSTQQQYQHILQDNGYKTAIFGKWHLMTTPTGFDHFMIHDNPSQQGDYWNSLYNTNGKKERSNGYCTKVTTEAALEWLKANTKGKEPFAMMLHYKAPHRPWQPDSCYMNLFDGVELPYPETFNDDYKGRELTLGDNMATIENHLSRHDMQLTPPEKMTPQQKSAWLHYGSGKNQFWTPDENLRGEELKKWKYQTYLKSYLSVVRSVDDQVGRVLDYLKENDLYDNTLIIYMGDQGFFLGEHGLYDKRWIYEESLIMPCLVSYPDGFKNKNEQVDAIALNVDIAPTILDIAGIEVPSDMQGKSFKGILEGDNKVIEGWRKGAYYQYFEYPLWHQVQPHYGIRGERYKLAHFYYNIDVWEFYDMQEDPNEMYNAINDPKYREVIDSMRRELHDLQVLYGDTLPLPERRKLSELYQVGI